MSRRASSAWLLMACLILAACSQEQESAGEETAALPEAPIHVEEPAAAEAPSVSAPAAAPDFPARPPFDRFDRYKVELGVEDSLTFPGPAGELRVWIGHEALAPQFAARMTTDRTFLAAVGDWAVIEPFAPAFDITPARSGCIKIDPTGAEVPFALRPTATGRFNVGANVYLYDSDDCAGAGVPKAASTLMVTVSVDKGRVLVGHLLQIWRVFWDNLLVFLGGVFALVFGWLIARLKKRGKQ